MEPKHIALGLGIVGGATVGHWGYSHLFIDGLTPDEKKNMAGFAVASGLLLIAGALGFDSWLSVEGIGGKVDKLAAGK